MSKMIHSFYDGKYTVIYDDTPEKEQGEFVDFRALRYGEEWGRSLAGDGLVLAMLQDFDELKTKANEFLADVVSAGETDEIINRFPSFGRLYDIARYKDTKKGGSAIEEESREKEDQTSPNATVAIR